ncbi:MAG: phosphoglucosamine mutase [Bacillota bacterium]
MGNLFGTDGIRGTANAKLTPELALRMGRIAASLLGRESKEKRPFFLLGRDTRLSGSMLEGALAAGITSTGTDVHLLGIVSTPAVAFLTRRLGARGGVMISASHNLMADNGIKFFGSEGYKLSDALEAEAEALYIKDEDEIPRPQGAAVGRVVGAARSVRQYRSFLRERAPVLQGIKVVLDCANGSLYRLAPALYRELGAVIVALGVSPDGTNINVNCGSTSVGRLQQAVTQHGADVGLAFDGDGDRLIAVDEQGAIVDGDAIMAVCATYLKEKNMLSGNTLVATVMSNGGLDLLAGEQGFRVLRTSVGDRFVLEEMQKGGYDLGGEQSGHIIFSRHLPTGDGLLTSLQLLGIMVEKGQPLSRLASIMRCLPQLLVNCRVKEMQEWEKNERIAQSIAQAKERLGTGRVLVRASGTEPLIRIMLEGDNNSLLQEISRELAAVVTEELGHA